MSKAAAATATVLAGSGLSLTGAYAMGAFESGSELDDMKEQYFLPGVNFAPGGKTWNDTHKPDANFLGDSDSAATGMLTVGWEKYECPTDQKWSGNFRWNWRFTNGSKSFSIFFHAKPSDVEKQLNLEGAFYLMEKKDGVWHVEYNRPMQKDKKLSKDTFDKVFPLMGDDINEGKDDKWGGFVGGKDDLEKVCKGEEIADKNEPKSDPFKKMWQWTVVNNKTGTLLKWTKDVKGLLSELYGDLGDFDLSTTLASFSGEWKQYSPSQ